MIKKTSTLFVFLILFQLSATSVNAQVVINEINPTEEWVELFNIDPNEVSLDGCYLTMGSDTQKVTFGPTDTLSGTGASKYKVVEKGTYNWTTNWLNNERDSVTLTCLSGSDSLTYDGVGHVCVPVSGESVGRYPDANNTQERFATPTKGTSNDAASLNRCPTPTPPPTETLATTSAPTSSPTATPTATKTPTPIKITPTVTPIVQETAIEDNSILGLRSGLTVDTPTPEGTGESTRNKLPPVAIVLVVIGSLVLGVSGFAFIKKVREDKSSPNEQNPPVS